MKMTNYFVLMFVILHYVRERSSITSAHWRGVGGLTENADADGGLRPKLMM